MSGTRSLFEAARARWRGFDPIARAMIANWFGGMLAGLLCAAALLAFDVLGIRALLWRSDAFMIGTVTLLASFAVSVGGVACTASVMAFRDEAPARRRGGRRARRNAPPRPTLAAIASRRHI